MNKEILIDTINSYILQQGFARIPAADVIKVFASGGNDLLTPSVELETLVRKHGWTFAHPAATQSNEYVFFPLGRSPVIASD